MAGSRYHKIGTIFSRVTGLLKSEAMSINDKPMWYDVYEAFPPKVAPSYFRPEPTNTIKTILYPEDVIRAKFYTIYNYYGTISLSESSRPSVCQIFIDEYLKMKKETDLSEDHLWEEVHSLLESRGIRLKKRDTKEALPTPKTSSTVKIKLSEYLKEEIQPHN